MTQHGISLQGYNKDLVKRLEELRSLRHDFNRQIASDEEKIRNIMIEIRNHSDSLALLNESLAKKLAARVEVDKTITDTELTYAKTLEKSQNLITVLKKDRVTPQQKPPI
uniref:Uncharacterized protein n=1 Tax=Strigamia maritima TaxID=126957 RepID=T1J1A0_STRMM